MLRNSFTVACLLLVAGFTVSADDLTPVGAPGSAAARMPSLSQIEPRQLIESLPYYITNSGPYVLTRNLTGTAGNYGIIIQTNSVTLDLKGFKLNGAPGSLSGVSVQGSRSSIVIKNGVIAGWGGAGVSAALANNSKIEDLLVEDNSSYGVALGTNCAVLRCTSADNTGAGFAVGAQCIIQDSTAKGNTGTGFDASSGIVIQKSVADHNGGYGFDVDTMGQISACVASTNGNNGFNLKSSCSVLDSCAYGNWVGFSGKDGIVFSRCVAYLNQYGMYAAKSCSFSDCSVYSNHWQGIYGDSGCSIKNCSAYRNYDGIGASGGSTISDSSATLNQGNGFWLGSLTKLSGCNATANSNGVAAQVGGFISGNMLNNNSAAGITASDRCRIENNHIVACNRGIELTGSENVIAGNTLLNNATNYNMSKDNQISILLSEVPATISWPSTVKFSGDLTGVAYSNGVNITTNGVCLDLGGHSLNGVTSSLSGIYVANGCSNVEIKNGTISKWGTYGISAYGAASVKVTGVSVLTNGTTTSHHGIYTGKKAVIKDSHSIGNRGSGIDVGANSIVTDCSAGENGYNGILVDEGSMVSRCLVYDNWYVGIWGNGPDTSIQGNSASRNQWGIYAPGALMVQNHSSGNTNNYSLSGSGSYGPLISGTGVITNLNPWANFDL